MFRPMRRHKQALSIDRCRMILSDARRGVLAVQGEHGYPYTVPLDFVYHDGKLYFHSAREGHKLDAIEKDGRCSFCVIQQDALSDDGWSYYCSSVVVFGHIRLVETDEGRRDALTALGQKYFPAELSVAQEIERDYDRVAVLELIPDHITGKRVHER